MKIILLTAAVFVLVSCKYDIDVKDCRDNGQLPFSYIKHFSYKGHDYIFFRTSYADNGVGGVVHDPECECNQGKEE